MWAWINIFEFFVAFPFIFAIIPVQGIPIEQMNDTILDGFKCLLQGKNTHDGDDCSNGLKSFNSELIKSGILVYWIYTCLNCYQS